MRQYNETHNTILIKTFKLLYLQGLLATSSWAPANMRTFFWKIDADSIVFVIIRHLFTNSHYILTFLLPGTSFKKTGLIFSVLITRYTTMY